MDSFDGFRSIDALEAWMIQAWKREEFLVLCAIPGLGANHESAIRARSVLTQGQPHCRYVLPAFLTICVKNTRKPYIELLWVRGDVRRMGVGSLMVNEVCLKQPGIRRVKSPLREAEPFWNAVSTHVNEQTWILHKPRFPTSQPPRASTYK
jgi:hypothetical protein